MKPRVIHSPAFTQDAAQLITKAAREAIQDRGIFRIGLCGGNTPRPVYARLARSGEIPWDKVQITFGDERCVPPEDSQSNYRMAKETLLDPARIPEGNILRIRGELPPRERRPSLRKRLAGNCPALC